MGDKQNEPFQLSFNASLKVDFQGSRKALSVYTELFGRTDNGNPD